MLCQFKRYANHTDTNKPSTTVSVRIPCAIAGRVHCRRDAAANGKADCTYKTPRTWSTKCAAISAAA